MQLSRSENKTMNHSKFISSVASLLMVGLGLVGCKTMPTQDTSSKMAKAETDTEVSYSKDPKTPQGYFCIPQGDGPFPAVVFHHGGHGYGKVIGGAPRETCQALAQAGFVGFSPIRRGINPRAVNLNDRFGGQLDEVFASVKYIRQHPKVDANKVGMMGFSYGAMLSLVALSEQIPVKAAIIMAPADPDQAPLKGKLGFQLIDVVNSKVQVPILTMISKYDTGSRKSGFQDLTKTVEAISKLAQKAGLNHQSIIYTDPSGHDMFFKVGDYWPDVVKFFKDKL